jgi:hypothetical protein
MITFKQYEDTFKKIAKKLKLTKDVALATLAKAQAKGINPLKWQKNIAMLSTFAAIVAEYDPVDERINAKMDRKQKVDQMRGYWNDLDHMASDKRKKKSLEIRFKIKNIKLDRRGNIISFEEDRDYKDEYKKFQSSEKRKKYRAELNKYNRMKGTYGNHDGKDASHKGRKIIGMEDQSTNRGRAEKSRLVGSKRAKSEEIKIPIEVGDIVKGGKFKNKKITVKKIGKNEKGDITINDRPLLKYRIIPQEENYG